MTENTIIFIFIFIMGFCSGYSICFTIERIRDLRNDQPPVAVRDHCDRAATIPGMGGVDGDENMIEVLDIFGLGS